jgi:hypothetical protein
MNSLINKLERKLGFKGIPDLPLYIVAGQVLLFFAMQSQPEFYNWTILSRQHVFQGELWRLLTFVFIPPTTNLLFAVFAWYIFYTMNVALEAEWGNCKLTIFLALGYFATILGTLCGGSGIVDNRFFLASTFLAFASLHPTYELLLFFVLPVQIKFISLFTWALYLLAWLSGGAEQKITIMAGILSYVVFFGESAFLTVKQWIRKKSFQQKQANSSLSKGGTLSVEKNKRYTRKCSVCGITDEDDSDLEFRYCTKCAGSPCFCLPHLKVHEHT